MKFNPGKSCKYLFSNQTVFCGVNVSSRSMSEYEVVIAGGGSGGISTGARLSRALGKGKVAIIDSSDVSIDFIVSIVVCTTILKV